MDKELEKFAVETCSEEAHRADEEKINAFIEFHPEWEVKIEPDATFLSRTFKFSNFVQAADFAAQVGDIAEQYNHHPRITLEFGKTRVDWWSHKIGNICALDLKLAADTDQLIKG